MTENKINTNVKIPKIIMQTWKTKDIPKDWIPSYESIKKHMSSWEHILMTDEDNRKFVMEEFPDFLSVYDSLEYPIMRVDAVRYMWLYKKGGIYMDLDIMLTKPLDPLFTGDNDIYFAKSANSSFVYTNAFMASKPGCKFWLECLDEIKKPYSKWQIGKHFKVMGKTGPLMLSYAINNTNHSYTTLPRNVITSCSVCDAKPCERKNGYAKILEGSSWCGFDTKVYTFLICKWKKIIKIIIILIVLLIVIIILRKVRRRYKNKK